MNKSPHFNNYNTGQQQRRIEVRTYEGLVNAISTLMSNYPNLTNSFKYLGYEIVICDSIVVPSPIILPEAVSGLTISSLGRVLIYPSQSANVETLFDIQGARGITIKDLMVVGNSTYFSHFVTVTSYTESTATPMLDGITLKNNFVQCPRFFYDNANTMNRAMISENRQTRPASTGADIVTGADMVSIINNHLGGGGITITGDKANVVGNYCGSGTITCSGVSSYIYGNRDASYNVDLNQFFLTEDGNLVVPKATTGGIMVDTDVPTWGWKDLLGSLIARDVGAGVPNFATFRGGNTKAYAFGVGEVMDFFFHIPHDYRMGTDMFVHVHWAHNGTAISGNFNIDLHHTYAKGHAQATFGAEKTLSISVSTPNIATIPQYSHRVDEFQLSATSPSASQIDSDDFEPDGLIMMRVIPTTIPTITGGSPNEPFILMVDLHYQTTSMPTKNKSPNFWT